LIRYADGNPIIVTSNNGGKIETSSGISSKLIRRKQVQTIEYQSDYTIYNTGTTNVFSTHISQQESGAFQGYTRIYFAGESLDDKEHTLIQNTVWTIDINPDNYDYNKSPSASGLSDTGIYPGAFLEPYIDKTQKFRILDIEEQEEFRYKITALQYDETKYDLGDNI
jgi:hypothetical protein